MTMGRTRCGQCLHADKKATQEPCNKCGEVQFVKKNFDNHFLEADKNFLKVN